MRFGFNPDSDLESDSEYEQPSRSVAADPSGCANAGSSATIPDERSGDDASDNSGSDDEDDSGSDNDSVISATSTLCSLVDEANDNAGPPTANAETEPDDKRGPRRAPLLLRAPEPTSADDELCKAVVLYNRSHGRNNPEARVEGRTDGVSNSEAHEERSTSPQNALQTVLHFRASQLVALEQARNRQCGSDFSEGAEEFLQIVPYSKASASAQTGDDQPSLGCLDATDSESPLPSQEIVLYNRQTHTLLHHRRCHPLQDTPSQEGRMSMRWENGTLVLQYTSPSGGIVKVEVEIDGTNTMLSADSSCSPSLDEETHDDFATDALPSVHEGNKDRQVPEPEAEDGLAVNNDSMPETVHLVQLVECEKRDGLEHANENTPNSCPQTQASLVERYEHRGEYGVAPDMHPVTFPQTVPAPELLSIVQEHAHDHHHENSFETAPCAYAYAYPEPYPDLVSYPQPAGEPQLKAFVDDHPCNLKSCREKRKLVRDIRREAHLRRQGVKRALTKHKRARKILRDAIEAITVDLSERCYNQRGCEVPPVREEDVVPMDVDEGYDAGPFKEDERIAMLGLSHKHTREAHAQAQNKQNKQNFPRRSLFANRSWYWVHKVMQVFTPNQLDLLLPWLSSWDGTRPNQRNWLVRSLRCISLRPRLDPFPAISFNVERTKRSENL